jgi:hypothetical protein
LNTPDLDPTVAVEPSPSGWLEPKLRSRGAIRRQEQIVAIAIVAVVAAGLMTLVSHGLGGNVRFDATSEDAFARSYQEIVRTIPAGDVEPLELAVEKIVRFYALVTGRPPTLADLTRKFDGKTAREVIEQARRLENPALSQSERDALAR